MSDDYTPTTAHVRDVYASGSFMLNGPGYYNVDDERGAAEFDRWLAEHDRQIAERAWALGKVAGKSVTMRRMSDEPTAPEPSNPYTPSKQRRHP